jgi:hypothetical protein
MTTSQPRLAWMRIALLSLAHTFSLGCTSEDIFGAVDSSGGSTASSPFGACGAVLPVCAAANDTCGCTQACASHLREARCAYPPVGVSTCACLVDDVQIASCNPGVAPTSADWVHGCDRPSPCRHVPSTERRRRSPCRRRCSTCRPMPSFFRVRARFPAP